MSASRSHHQRRARARRLSRIGLAGLVGVLVTAPLAYAETPSPAPSSTVATTQTSASPSSELSPSASPTTASQPTDSQPTTPPSDVSSAPSADPGTSSPTSADASSSASAGAGPSTTPGAAPSSPAADLASESAAGPRIEADFGLTKIRVGARVAPGSTPPDGVTTAGSVIHVAYTGDTTSGASDFDCTTEGPPDANGVTYCPGQVLVGVDDDLVLTQTSAPEGLLVDPDPRPAEPDPSCQSGQFCYGPDLVFDDPGVDAPSAADDSAEATVGRGVDLDLVANDELHGRDVTGLTTTAPAHGTVTVVDATTGQVRYVPEAGFEGSDTFTYTVVTAAGSATATVTVAVEAAPTGSTTTPPTSDGGSDGDDPSGGTTLAATGAPSGGRPLGLVGVLLGGAGSFVLLRRRRPRGSHV